MHCFISSSLGYFPEYSRCSVKKINSKYKQYCACLPYRKPQSRHKWLNRVQCLDCRDVLPLIPPPTLPQGMDHLRGGGQCFPALLDVPLADPELVMMAQATVQRTFHLRLFNWTNNLWFMQHLTEVSDILRMLWLNPNEAKLGSTHSQSLLHNRQQFNRAHFSSSPKDSILPMPRGLWGGTRAPDSLGFGLSRCRPPSSAPQHACTCSLLLFGVIEAVCLPLPFPRSYTASPNTSTSLSPIPTLDLGTKAGIHTGWPPFWVHNDLFNVTFAVWLMTGF